MHTCFGDCSFLGEGPPRSARLASRLIEQIAAVGDYLVALETYRAAVKRWPKDKITLHNRARVIEQSWRD